MKGYREIITSELLCDLWNKQAASSLEQQQGFSLLDEEVKNVVKGYKDGHIQMSSLLEGKTADLLASLTAQSSALEQLIRAGNEQTTNISHHLKTIQENSQIFRFRKSLQFENTRPKAVKAYRNTFEWVYSDKISSTSEYKNWENWLHSDGHIFWIQGKAGSGKSTMMNYSANNPRTKEILPDCAVHSYFL